METQSFTSFLENHSWPTAQLFDDWLSAKTYNLSLEEISKPDSRIPIAFSFFFSFFLILFLD
jgi:hypothetical protein